MCLQASSGVNGLNIRYCSYTVKSYGAVPTLLRLERGGEHVIRASRTKTIISQRIYKISIHMIHQKIAYF